MRNKCQESLPGSTCASGSVPQSSDSATTLQKCLEELEFFYIPVILLAMFGLVSFLIVTAVFFPASELGLWAGNQLGLYLDRLYGL